MVFSASILEVVQDLSYVRVTIIPANVVRTFFVGFVALDEGFVESGDIVFFDLQSDVLMTATKRKIVPRYPIVPRKVVNNSLRIADARMAYKRQEPGNHG